MLNATSFPSKVQWTDERVEKGRALVAAGYSYSKAAIEIGVTKGALIGKLSRLDMKPDRGLPIIRVADPRRSRTLKVNVMTRRAAPRPLVERVQVDEPAPLKIPYMELGPFHCRKIVNGETGDDCLALSCGHPTQENSSYCSYHHARFWVRPR